MPEDVESFFDTLQRQRHHDILGDTRGKLRFDLECEGQIQSWLVDLRDGAVEVAQQAGDADCVVNMPRNYFEAAVSGAEDMRSGWLRHVYVVHGSLFLLRAFERLLPQRPGMSNRRHARLAPRAANI